MQNFIQSGKVLSLVAPAGGVKAGDFVVVGGLHGFAITDAAEGENVSASREGVFSAPKAAVEVHQGDPLYWDALNKVFTPLATGAANVAVAVDDAAAEASTCILVLVDAMSAEGDIQGVTAGTGLTGGGTSGTVTLAANLSVLAGLADLASNENGKGASLIGIEDAAGEFTATTVEDALHEVAVNSIYRDEIDSKDVVIAMGASSGSSVADPAWVGASVIGIVPVSGNDQIVASVAVDGTGMVTVTTAGNETAEATFRVTAVLD